MNKKSGSSKTAADKLVKNIRHKTRQTYSVEENIRIVLAGRRATSPSPKSAWNPISQQTRDSFIEHEALTSCELAVRYTDEKRYYISKS